MCARVSFAWGHLTHWGECVWSRLWSSVCVGMRCVQNLCLKRVRYSGQYVAPVGHSGVSMMRSNWPSILYCRKAVR